VCTANESIHGMLWADNNDQLSTKHPDKGKKIFRGTFSCASPAQQQVPLLDLLIYL